MMTLKERIQEHEGLRLHPYLDTAHIWTIGWGRNLLAKGIRLEEADLMLDNDIEMATAQYDNLPEIVRWRCDNVRRDVIIEMLFQLGLVGTLKFRRMFAAVEKGDFKAAAFEMTDSLWFRQTPRRCQEMSDRMFYG